ncbi:unnamed protein product [Victoria cruziana]
MNDIFRQYLRNFVLVFFDDILIYSRDLDQHVIHIRTVLQILRDHNLYAKMTKCSFGQTSVGYLGHIVSKGGVRADPEKLHAMQMWPLPKSPKGLRGFLGLTGYYRRFIQGYGKGAFAWNESALRAFERLKAAMLSAPVLALPDFSREFVVETDASEVGVGAVLSQEGHPIAFMSKALTHRARPLSTYEKELLAIVLAVDKWRPYLLGRHFTRWLAKLLGYDFTIEYKKGTENSAADSLSRLPEQVMTLSALTSDLWEHSPLAHDLMEHFHASAEAGHEGVAKTLSRIKAQFWWKGLKADITAYVRTCQICQREKYEATKPPGHLRPLPIPMRPWVDVSMDFIDAMPRSDGKEAILVVVDRLTKYSHFAPLPKRYNGPMVASIYQEYVGKLHGMPHTIVCDRDSIFLSSFWQEYMRLAGTRLHFSTAHHPQTDGQSEVVNRTLETYLRCYAGERPTTWAKHLSWAEWSYNTSLHSSIGRTPYEALYGYAPPTIPHYEEGTAADVEIDSTLQDRDELLRSLHEHIAKAQNRMKQVYNKGRKDREFEVGDMVWLKRLPLRQRSLLGQPYSKLLPKFYGPFRVL